MSPIAFPRLLSPVSAQILTLLPQLAAFERQPPAAQAQAQSRQLAALLRHAQRHSPFWRERLAPFDKAMRLHDLPVLSRADLQARADEIRCEKGTPLPLGTATFTAQTSGSTGTPVRVTKSAPLYNILYQAQALRHQAWHKMDTNLDAIAIRDAQDGVRDKPWGLVPAETGSRARCFVMNMIEHPAEDIWKWLRTLKAPYLTTTAAMVLRLAELAAADRDHGFRLDAVMTFGEVVRPEHRRAAREAFGARIVDRYSSEEVGWMAFQCPRHDHYHALSATTLVEVVDDDDRPVAPGEEGRVLVTSMHSYAMPIIRYDIGDRAVAGEPCDCGIRLPVIKEILGRERSFVMLPDGSTRLARLTGEYWREIAPVREYRVVQYRDGEIEGFVTTERPPSAEEIQAMEAMLRDRLHPSLKVRVTPVERIDWNSRWKRLDIARVDHLRGEAP